MARRRGRLMRIAPATDTASRFVPSSPESVWRALTDPGLVVRWLPPAGAKATIEVWDPAPGGPFLLTLIFGDGSAPAKTTENTDVVRGRFSAVDAGRRLVQDVDFASDDPAFAGTMRMTWEVAPASGGTELRVTCENVPPGIGAEDHDAGLASSLENLARCLAPAACDH